MRDTVLTGRDRKLLDEYSSFEDVDDPEILADYMRALSRFVIVAGREDKTYVGNLLRMNGVANNVETGEITVEEAKEFVRDLDVSTPP